VLLRHALPSDASRIQELYTQLLSDSKIEVTEQGIKMLADGHAALLICETDQMVAGTVLVNLCADVMYGLQPFAVVENLVVDTQYRKKGIGEAMLAGVEKFCMAAGCSKIMLLSSAHRTDAHRLFIKAGYAGDAKRGFVRYRSDVVTRSSDEPTVERL
jgi:N-acetylglutamate synthase-like GNAT family acetyltransferase